MRITKEYLKETREMHISLEKFDEELQYLKAKAENTSAGLPDSMRVQTSRKFDVMESRIIQYTAMQDLYMGIYSEYLDRCGLISSGIRPLPYREQIIILAYYVEAENVLDICDRLYISRETFYRILRSALTHIKTLD